MAEHALKRLPLEEIQADIPKYLDKILLEHDFDTERALRETGRNREVKFISCKGLVANKTLMEQMQRMLRCIQDEYDYPVDTEFTINMSESGEYSIDLLQCRPLQVQKGKSSVAVPKGIPKEKILLESKGASMGISKASSLDYIVFVDPVKYYNMPYNDKMLVARLIGKINWHFAPEKLTSVNDIVMDFTAETALKDIVHVYDLKGVKSEVFNDVANEHLMITCEL
ncbi:MAG: hypothetical protein E7242_03615 [Lachnospiraceae bacterium]|nr:hypothetical protein [Lachnospiraceae bacterium]